AGVLFALVLGISSSFAVASYGDPLAEMIGAFTGCYTIVAIIAILSSGRRAANTFRAERDAASQSQLVGLLLRDFETQSSDVLWEIDTQGLFGRISPKLRSLMQLGTGDMG